MLKILVLKISVVYPLIGFVNFLILSLISPNKLKKKKNKRYSKVLFLVFEFFLKEFQVIDLVYIF